MSLSAHCRPESQTAIGSDAVPIATSRRAVSAVSFERSEPLRTRWRRSPGGTPRRSHAPSPASATVRNPKPAISRSTASRPISTGRAWTAVPGEGSTPRSAIEWSSRPRNRSPKSTPSEGNRITPPATTATITATSVSCDAAACSTVKPGSKTGFCASAQPATTAATATTAPTRAASKRRVQTSPSVATPATAEATSAGRPLPFTRPSYSGWASWWTTTSPATASAPATTPGAERACAEAPLELVVSEPTGIRAQEDRGQVRARRDREQADEDRGRVEPARDEVARGVADGHPAGGDRRRRRRRARTASGSTRARTACSIARCSRRRASPARSAYVAPRKMIPTARRRAGTPASTRSTRTPPGTRSSTTTSTKISQTWFASQTGPMACVRVVADSSAGSPAARRERPEAGAEVRAGEHRVGREARRERIERKVVESSRRLRRSRARLRRGRAARARAGAAPMRPRPRAAGRPPRAWRSRPGCPRPPSRPAAVRITP